MRSIYGRKLGMDGEVLLSPGGLSSGRRPIIVNDPTYVSWFDDFQGDVVDARYSSALGSDVTGTVPAITLSTTLPGGVVVLATGDSASSINADGVQLARSEVYVASNGGVVVEYRVRLSSITNVSAFFGFSSQPVTLGSPAAASGGTIATLDANAVGFLFDTALTTNNWWLVGVANDVDATFQDVGAAPVANTYETLRVELAANGAASFFRNGRQVGLTMSGAVGPAALIYPKVSAFPRTTAQVTMAMDYMYSAMKR